MNPIPMLHKLVALALATTLSTTLCRAQDAGQILDVRIAKNGNIEDESKENRSLEIRSATVSKDKKSAALEKLNAIIIPFKENDPLFQNGPQTWLFRIKMPDPLSAPSACLAGRWNSGENRRSIGLLTQGNEGRMQFLVSADGSAATAVGVAPKEGLPAGEWTTVVVKFQPEVRMEISIYDDSANLISERALTNGVPASLFEDDLPFWIGAPSEVAMEFSRFAVWKRILSDSQITSALKNTP